jgi:hypothetical protein
MKLSKLCSQSPFVFDFLRAKLVPNGYEEMEVSSGLIAFGLFPRSLLYSSTLIKISRGLPRWVIVIGPCSALAIISPDFRDRSEVEYRIRLTYSIAVYAAIAVFVVCQALK